MKLSIAAAALLSFSAGTVQGQGCDGTYEFDIDGPCTPESIEAAFTTVATACTVTDEVREQFVCPVYDFLDLTIEPGVQADYGRYYQFQKCYMDGGCEWNTDVESTVPIKTSAGRIGRVESDATSSELGWPEYEALAEYRDPDPGYMSNFDLTNSCQSNTVLCCFTNDRTGAADGDAMANNAGVCSHEVGNSHRSNHIDNGWVNYDGTDSAYCEGFTWGDEGSDSDRFKANLLFQVSFWNTFNNGYVLNIPGAPMCACIEQMPQVTKAASVSVAKGATDQYTFGYSNGTMFKAEHNVDLTFTRTDDLVAANPTVDLSKHIAECDADAYLNSKLFVPGEPDNFGVSDSQWEKFVGEGFMYQPMIGEEALRDLLEDSETGIMYRKCLYCWDDFKDVYYKRFTSYEGDLLELLMNEWSEENNVLGEDMCIYSSYEAAVAGSTTSNGTHWTPDENCWKSADYTTREYEGYGFPRNSHPLENRLSSNQWNSYAPTRQHGDANHHGWFVDVSTSSPV